MCEKCDITRSTLIMVLAAAGADTAARGESPDFMAWVADNETVASLCEGMQIPVALAENEWRMGYSGYGAAKEIYEAIARALEDNEDSEEQPHINTPGGTA